MYYKIVPDSETKGSLHVPKKFLEGHTISKMDSVSISAGLKKKNAAVVVDPLLGGDELVISDDVLEILSIPVDIRYQVLFEDGGIRLGPVIGLLMARGERGLSKRCLREALHYTMMYPEIRGLIYVFSLEGIDYKTNMIEGYYFSTGAIDAVRKWRKGLFPIADSVYSRVIMHDDERLKLKMITNNRLFNSYYFDKWTFWKMVSKCSALKDHIPETRMYSSMNDVDDMLQNHGTVYLKPIHGTLARGLIKVTKKDGGYHFHGGEQERETASRDGAERLIKRITHGSPYLVQQSINPLDVEGRHMDFRVIMQKDHTREWGCTGIVAFFGRPGGICSNWGYQLEFDEVFTRHFNFSQEKIYRIRQSIVAECLKVCALLDDTGENYGDLGFDVILDESMNSWILEVNKRQYHIVPLWINDEQTFYAVKSNPVKYAVALSGFEVH